VPQQDGGDARPCEGCDEPAVVYCSKCEAALCAACNDEEHVTKLQKKHVRIPIGGGGKRRASSVLRGSACLVGHSHLTF
jgi:hypothetical protein